MSARHRSTFARLGIQTPAFRLTCLLNTYIHFFLLTLSYFTPSSAGWHFLRVAQLANDSQDSRSFVKCNAIWEVDKMKNVHLPSTSTRIRWLSCRGQSCRVRSHCNQIANTAGNISTTPSTHFTAYYPPHNNNANLRPLTMHFYLFLNFPNHTNFRMKSFGHKKNFVKY